MLFEWQPVEARTRRVDQPQAHPSVLLDRDRWIHTSGSRDHASFPAGHPLHEPGLNRDAAGVLRYILEDEDYFRRSLDLRNGIQLSANDDRRRQAAPYLARDRTMHVGMNPKGASGVIRRER